MKVSFLGAGAVGSMFGGLLKHYAPSVEVVLVARGRHGQALLQRGAVDLLGPWGTRRVSLRTTLDIADIADSDFVFVTVKSQATDEALRQAAPYFGKANVVSIQNGINDETFLQFIPPERLVMGMTTTNIVLYAPGQAKLQIDGHTLFGPPAGSQRVERAQRVADLLRPITEQGLSFSAQANAVGMRYNKLIINALGCAASLSSSHLMTEAIGHAPWRHTIGQPLVQESQRVLTRAGIRLEALPGRSDIFQLERLMQLLDRPILGTGAKWGLRALFRHRPILFSFRQDLQQGRPTEVDHINGHFVRLAESVGEIAPLNQEIVRITHQLEQHPPGSFWNRQEVIDRLSAVDQGSQPSNAQSVLPHPV